ncbi:GNAT family N-acetyltransferase [Jeotgalibacillus sp. S-D1]|uniref:GNAT family N-acetyltransferase n=1 Tax=Jeotgalibacillus sp. S-D1 TaxID=2552189 RepID=UPI0014048704|nr:GNAT family N-acetyltransferase [Jeotgalibacillus sp. S-D1]
MSYTFVRTTNSEKPLIIIKTVASWLKGRGSSQWDTYLLGEEDRIIAYAAERGETFLIFHADIPIATFNVSRQPNKWDLSLWGENNDQTFYLHRVAVIPSYMGHSIGNKIMEYVEELAMEENVPAIRLDCSMDNKKLNTFYEMNGYSKIKSINGMTLYQKQLGAITC